MKRFEVFKRTHMKDVLILFVFLYMDFKMHTAHFFFKQFCTEQMQLKQAMWQRKLYRLEHYI